MTYCTIEAISVGSGTMDENRAQTMSLRYSGLM